MHTHPHNAAAPIHTLKMLLKLFHPTAAHTCPMHAHTWAVGGWVVVVVLVVVLQ